MSTLIERYVYDVTRRLPESSRADVERELKANINDMLPENPSSDDVERVLASMGAPAKLAEQYRARPRYLISPALFDDYLTVLKIVIPLIAVILTVLRLFSTLIGSPQDGSFGQVFGLIISDILGGLFEGITNGFFWVTLGFGLAEYLNAANSKDCWSTKDLPAIPPSNTVKISRVETIIGMVFSAVFLVVMAKYQHLIAWYESGPEGIHLTLFNAVAVSRYLPYLTGLTLLSWVVAAVKFYFARWNYPVALASGISSIFWTAASILFLKGTDTFNPAFIQHAAQRLEIDMAVMNGHWQTGITVICVLSLIGTAVDVASGFFKARKGRIMLDVAK